MPSNRSPRVRVLTLVGMLVVSGVSFYSAYDAISTGITKAPGRNNNHYVIRSAEPHVFHSLVSFDIGAGILFAVVGIAGYIVDSVWRGPSDRGDQQ
jgi:hypothetical protein